MGAYSRPVECIHSKARLREITNATLELDPVRLKMPYLLNLGVFPRPLHLHSTPKSSFVDNYRFLTRANIRKNRQIATKKKQSETTTDKKRKRKNREERREEKFVVNPKKKGIKISKSKEEPLK